MRNQKNGLYETARSLHRKTGLYETARSLHRKTGWSDAVSILLQKSGLRLAAIVLSLTSGLPAQVSAAEQGFVGPLPDQGTQIELETEILLEELTLEQKVAQMFFVTPGCLTESGETPYYGDPEAQAFSSIPVGGIIIKSENIASFDQLSGMIGWFQELSENTVGLPLFMSVDEEGGIVTRVAGSGIMETPYYESMLSVGSTGDPAAAYEVGSSIGGYLAALGFNMDFAPVADVLTNPYNEVIGSRSFGSDPYMVADMVTAAMEGFRAQGLMSTVKHFPGHGDTYEDSHSGMASSGKTLEELWQCELVPFQRAIQEGVEFVMVGHISCPAITGDNTPASLSYFMCTQLLREQMGFEGIVITDAMNMGAVMQYYDSDSAAVAAVQAGEDMLLLAADLPYAYHSVLQAVYDGRIPEERIDSSVRRILQKKLEMRG